MTTDTHNGSTEQPELTVDVSGLRYYAVGGVALGGLGLITFGLLNNSLAGEYGLRDFFMAYLVGFVFWASLPFGALALMNIGFLGSANFGIVMRRTWQASIRTLPVLGLMFIPVVLSLYVQDGKQSPFWWSDTVWDGEVENISSIMELTPDAVEENQHKIEDYLSPGFFTIRGIVYFVVLGLLATMVLSWSKRAEENDDQTYRDKLKGAAGPIVILWALMMTFAATDWVMSVEHTWASSMFPVVFGMNQFVTVFAFSALVFYHLTDGKEYVLSIVKDKFRIDMGSLIFGFTMVWAYATFSQYMLIWAGNLPEEIVYYLKRTQYGWDWLAYFLMAFHWFIPFLLFLFREVKTSPTRMRYLCTLLLIVCAADVIWWIMPAVERENGGYHVPMAVSAILLLGGIWGLAFTYFLGQKPILPENSETKFLANWGHHH